MGINKAVLRCDRTATGDETYTPFYAVEPIIKYIPKDKTVWCPFDQEWSAYYRLLKERGYSVVRSSLEDGQDFFYYEPESWDIVISNPPFSIKDRVLERLYDLGKPFAVLLPLTTLQGKGRYQSLKNGVQILAFDKRIAYYREQNQFLSCSFPSAYFCRNLIPDSLILEELQKYNRPLVKGADTEKTAFKKGANQE